MGDPWMGNYDPCRKLRCCATCSAHILTNDGVSQSVYCAEHQPRSFDEWAATVKPDDRVYLQPVMAWRGLSRSENLVLERDGDLLTVQIIGIPESRQQVRITQCAERDMTPRRGML
jgi:hypothetical protein